jgi:hypothetical protein
MIYLRLYFSTYYSAVLRRLRCQFWLKKPELLNEDICGFGPPLRIAVTIERSRIDNLAEKIIGLGANIHQELHGLQLPLSPSFSDLYRVDILQKVKWSPDSPVPKVESAIRTIFHEFAQWADFSYTPNLDLYHHFLRNGADINLEDDEGATLLHYAALGDNLPVFMALIQDGANVNCKTKEGKTVFDIAYQNSSLRILEYLVESGVVIIPPDITCSQLIDYVSQASIRGLLNGQLDPKVSILRILQDTKYDITTRYCQPDTNIPKHCEKASCIRNEQESFSSTSTESYITIPFQGITLKRVEFKICSVLKGDFFSM